MSNLLGALALAVTDRIDAATQSVLGRSGETPSAIVVIGFEGGMSNDRLRQILGISHAGAVRLVDRLVSDGLVERRRGKDGRAVALHLTRSGFKRRDQMLSKRFEAIRPALEVLSIEEKEVFVELVQKILASLEGSEIENWTICRLCDTRACTDCPLP